MSVKEEVLALIRQLPDDCTIEDVHYHLYVRQKVDNGLKAAEEGRVISQTEVRKRYAQWLTQSQ